MKYPATRKALMDAMMSAVVEGRTDADLVEADQTWASGFHAVEHPRGAAPAGR